MWTCMEDMHRGCPKGALERSCTLNETINDSENDYAVLEVDWVLKFVHEIKRLHLDMKSDRALLRRDGNIQLADFEFCAELTESVQRRQKDANASKLQRFPARMTFMAAALRTHHVV